MYFITERFFKSRFTKKDDQQKGDSPAEMRTAELPSIEESAATTKPAQAAATKSSSNIQGSSEPPTSNSSTRSNVSSVKKNVQI
uniref:Uncharacterized protein n=1 Tax=Panagrolaimus sp. PS1159 TaxID=55785 RepID=A0AC35GXV3_9BILA